MIHPPGATAPAPAGIHAWALWSIPASARAFVLVVEAVGAALTVGLLVGEHATTGVIARFGLLLALSIGYAESSQRSERIKRYLGAGRPTPRPNPLSVWSFAGLLVLPAGWAALLIAAQYGHAIMQRRREQTSKTYRQVFVAAAAMLAQLAAAIVLVEWAAGDGLHNQFQASVSAVGAAALFTAADLGLMMAGMWLTTRPPSVRSMLPDGDALSYELTLLALGVAVAELLVHSPWLVVVMVGPVAYIHRSSMIKTLRQAARTDDKTGLLNTAAWTDHARGVLSRCARSGQGAAVVIIDVDHFKSINDRVGHLVGDQVLAEVARVLQHELRGHDGISRFGGDEFVVMLENVDARAAEAVATRLHTALSAIKIQDLVPTASMGIAHTGMHGTDLPALLAAADTALYTAKAGGRHRLCVAPASPA